MSHPVIKFRRPESLQPGQVEAEPTATYAGVSGSMTHYTAATIAEAALPIGVSGSQRSSLYGNGG